MPEPRKYGLSIDPGKSSGIALFSWSAEEPFQRDGVWQVAGGAWGLREHLLANDLVVSPNGARWGAQRLSVVVVEKFTPRQSAGFNLTEDAVEPLRCEGMLFGLGLPPDKIAWRHPASQYFIGSWSGEQSKRDARNWLRSQGLYLTGSDVGQRDGHDAMSATLHAIGYLRGRKHLPTLLTMFPPKQKADSND